MLRLIPDSVDQITEEAGAALHDLRPDLEQLAGDDTAVGHAAAVQLLARLKIPHPAVLARAEQLADQILTAPVNVARSSFTLGGHVELVGIYGRHLPPHRRAPVAQKLAALVEDGSDSQDARAAAAYGLYHLASTLPEPHQGRSAGPGQPARHADLGLGRPRQAP